MYTSSLVSSANFILLLCLIAVSAGCASSGEARSSRSASVLEEIEPTVPLVQQVSRIAGVYLNEYGELRIRGSVGPPLVIVDGARIGTRGDLSFVSPYDVERIEVVKGPETAYYGMGARDGVILITTKRGDQDS